MELEVEVEVEMEVVGGGGKSGDRGGGGDWHRLTIVWSMIMLWSIYGHFFSYGILFMSMECFFIYGTFHA